MVDPRIYTEAEYKSIVDGAAEYDRQAAKEIAAQKAYEAAPHEQYDMAADVYKNIKDDNMDTLKFLGEDIGVIRKVMERFRDDSAIQERGAALIFVEQELMREITQEIINGR